MRVEAMRSVTEKNEDRPDFLGRLVSRKLIGARQAEEITTDARKNGRSQIAQLYQTALFDSRDLAREVAEHYGLPLIADDEWPAELILAEELSSTFLVEHEFLPLALAPNGALLVAISDPEDKAGLAMLEMATRRVPEPRIAAGRDIVAAFQRLSRKGTLREAEISTASSADGDDIEQLNDLALEAPVIELVNRLLLEAVMARATDLHLEAERGRVSIRRRIDGMLQAVGTLPANLGRAAISRIKILARLNIAERRLPQDGQARVRINDRDYDLRVATIPTVHGEGAAIRLLATATQIPDLGRLGLNKSDESRWRRALAAPHGLLIVTGPTGSGKTTTLASSLSILNVPQRKLITIEDPVEYQIDGVNQIQVKPEIGMSFTTALRSILRHDPDVIMLGEIRDTETAAIAVHAALTGHLVLTTLHTNSAAGAVTRLLDMGVEGYLLASALKCVAGQRLVRCLCSHCKQPDDGIGALPAELLARAGIGLAQASGWKATGCERCNGTGYTGRIAIFEVMSVDESLQPLIRPDVGLSALETAARAAGMTGMIADGVAKWRAGLTSVEELVRTAMNI